MYLSACMEKVDCFLQLYDHTVEETVDLIIQLKKQSTFGGYMNGGKGKLTDCAYGQTSLPYHDVNVATGGSNWLLRKFHRNLDVYFKFETDNLIDSISINVLSENWKGTFFSYIYSRLVAAAGRQLYYLK